MLKHVPAESRKFGQVLESNVFALCMQHDGWMTLVIKWLMTLVMCDMHITGIINHWMTKAIHSSYCNTGKALCNCNCTSLARNCLQEG